MGKRHRSRQTQANGRKEIVACGRRIANRLVRHAPICAIYMPTIPVMRASLNALPRFQEFIWFLVPSLREIPDHHSQIDKPARRAKLRTKEAR